MSLVRALQDIQKKSIYEILDQILTTRIVSQSRSILTNGPINLILKNDEQKISSSFKRSQKTCSGKDKNGRNY